MNKVSYTKFQAYNGEEFDTEQDCNKYEFELLGLDKAILLDDHEKKCNLFSYITKF